MTTQTSLALCVAIGVLLVDAVLEMGFVTGMVAWLASTASGSFGIRNGDGTVFQLAGKPANISLDQGHTSNGAAGTAVIIICLGGIVALSVRAFCPRSGLARAFYYLWLGFNVPALLLTIAALAYVFAVTNAHSGQTIDLAVAASLPGQDDVKYALDTWTPQSWFSAVLQLDVADPAVRTDIVNHLRIMRAWEYNLIPMFLVQLVETVLAFRDWARWRKEGGSRYDAVHSSAQNIEYKG